MEVKGNISEDVEAILDELCKDMAVDRELVGKELKIGKKVTINHLIAYCAVKGLEVVLRFSEDYIAVYYEPVGAKEEEKEEAPAEEPAPEAPVEEEIKEEAPTVEEEAPEVSSESTEKTPAEESGDEDVDDDDLPF